MATSLLRDPATSSSPLLYYTDHHVLPLPDGHKFPIRKYQMVRELLQTGNSFRFTPAPFCDPETLALAHDPQYVRDFLAGTLTASAMRRIGLPWSESLVRRALASVGGTIAASGEALRAGWGGTLGGGTHHAYRTEGSGFCVFNDIAVAIRKLQTDGRIRRAAVIDLDVHQGDGTATIFEGDRDILTISLHCGSNFPFRKKKSCIDVSLPDHTGDDEYLLRLADVLPEAFSFAPDLIFYQAGVDPLREDRLGRLAMTARGLRERDHMVFAAAREHHIPVVVTSGGGYAQPLGLSAQAHAETYRQALRVFGPVAAV